MLLLNNVIQTDVPQKVPFSDDLVFYAQDGLRLATFEKEDLTLLSSKRFNSNRLKSYYEDTFEGRIIIVESNYTLGEITEDYPIKIEIYNNTGSNKTINELNFNGLSGVEYTLSDTVIKNSNSVVLNLTILKSGEADNDGYIELGISGNLYYINLSYSRSNVFDFFVNRSQNIIVTYSYLTEIMQSLNLKETRINYLDRPRLGFQYSYLVDEEERRTFENQIMNADVSNTYVPLVWENFTARFADNNKIFFDDISYLNLKTNDYILVETYDSMYKKAYKIDLINNSSKYIQVATDFDENLNNNYVNVKPLVKAKLINVVNATRITSDLYSYLITFNVDSNDNDKDFIEDQENFSYQSINDIEYYPELLANTADQTSKTFQKNIRTLDNTISMRKFFTYNSVSQINETFTLMLDGKKEISRLKNIFKRNLGRTGSFYKIKADDDMTVISPIAINGNSIIVKDNNLRQSFANGVFDAIMINYNNYDQKTFLITDVRKTLTGEELVLSTAITEDIDISKINIVTMLNIVRFDSDSLTLTYISDELASTSLTFQQVIVK